MALSSTNQSLLERLARLNIHLDRLQGLHESSPTSSTSTIVPSSAPNTMHSTTPDATPSTKSSPTADIAPTAELVTTPTSVPSVDNEAKCAICQEPFTDNYITAPCQHILHITCLRDMLKAQALHPVIRCPYCRVDFSWARQPFLKCMVAFDIHDVTWQMACLTSDFRPDILSDDVAISAQRLPTLHLSMGEVFSVLQRNVWLSWREDAKRRCPRDGTCKHKFIARQATGLQDPICASLRLELIWNSLGESYGTLAVEHWSTYITELLRAKCPTIKDTTVFCLRTCWLDEAIREFPWFIRLFEMMTDRTSATGGFLGLVCFNRWLGNVAEMEAGVGQLGYRFGNVAKGVVEGLCRGDGSTVSPFMIQ